MEFFNYISKLERMYKDPKTVYASVFVIMDVLEEERKPVRIIDRIYLDGMKHNLRLKLSNL
jgi:hypothetical protein